MLSWLPRHAELQSRLLCAARLAPERDPVRFGQAWQAFVQALTLHMGQEEATLLPAFDALAERASPNQRPAVVRRDHELMRELLSSVELEPRTARAVWERAEKLELLLDILHHHDLREAQGMLAVLQAEVDPRTLSAWLERFSAEELALPVWEPPQLQAAPAPWPWQPADELEALGMIAAQDGDLEPVFAAIPTPTARVPARLALAAARLVAEPTSDLVSRRDRARAMVARVRLWRIAKEAV